MRLLAALAFATVVSAPTTRPVPVHTHFVLYKMMNRIGIEDAVLTPTGDGDAAELRTAFAFTDRFTTVPLAATLSLGRDGAPVRFAVWGKTSRITDINDAVTVDAARKELVVVVDGQEARRPVPPSFFVAAAYAPMAVTEQLFRYWSRHGRPAKLATFPAGEVSILRRGADDVTDDEGKPARLERYALGGLAWGRETFWVTSDGRLAAWKGVDADFDPFEVARTGFTLAIPKLVQSAAADGMSALQELARSTATSEAGTVVYAGGRLVDGTGAPAVPDASVVVKNGRILAAGPRGKIAVPAGARVVELGGKTILPGLWDMHAHLSQVEWGPIYLAAGVTTVRDCGNEQDFIVSMRDAVEAGKGLGPRVLLACFVDGRGPNSVGTQILTEESEIPALIKRFHADRCEQVKIYQSFPPGLIAPLSKAAHAAGMTVTGHIPTGIGPMEAIEAGLDMVSHIGFVTKALLPAKYRPADPLWRAARLRALDDLDVHSAQAQAKLARLAQRHVVVDPTMAVEEIDATPRDELVRVEPGLAKVAPQLAANLSHVGATGDDIPGARKSWKASRDTLRALHAAGVTVVAGTDQGVPGHSLHREIELYVEAGFSPMEAIQAATIVPARAMKRDKDLGTIEVGKVADLVFVDGDPLADIHALRKVVTVVAGGRAYETKALWPLVGFSP